MEDNIQEYQLLNTEILIGDEEIPAKLYVKWDNNKVRYVVETTEDGEVYHNYFESTKHPEKLTEEERHRVLSYCLSSFDKDEIVNYNDLFLQGEFIKSSTRPERYVLTESWKY